MENIEKQYTIKFDINNSNLLLIFKDNKLYSFISIPPTRNSIDIFNFSGELYNGSTHNFNGLVVITSDDVRSVYKQGVLLDHIELN